jgi:hypothetical protein
MSFLDRTSRAFGNSNDRGVGVARCKASALDVGHRGTAPFDRVMILAQPS